MKIINLFQCDICGEKYETVEKCMECENTPIRYDKGVKIGDKVTITRGDGKGDTATVKKINVLPSTWHGNEYKHTTKEVLENFNPGKDITLSRKEDDINRNVWYSVLQKLRTARKNIKKTESGNWKEERIGQEKEYRFVKY